MYIKGQGSFCDAGPWQNNPIFLARSEFAALYGDDEPDCIVSCGTGFTADESGKIGLENWFTILRDAFMSIMEGRRDWHKFISS